MNNEIKIFENPEFGQVRTIEEDGKILFCGSDVAKALGYARPNEAISKHCKGTLKRRTPTAGGIQDMLFISEGDIYRLVVKSKLPCAEKFESWVFDEVIPSIRKTGVYLAPTITSKELFIIAQNMQRLEEENNVLKEQKLCLENKIEQDKPNVEWANQCLKSDTTLLIGEFAKILYKENDIEIGQNRLFAFLRQQDVLNEKNIPYQVYMERGWFEVIERPAATRYGVKINYTTKVTPKGQKGIFQLVKKYYHSNSLVCKEW